MQMSLTISLLFRINQTVLPQLAELPQKCITAKDRCIQIRAVGYKRTTSSCRDTVFITKDCPVHILRCLTLSLNVV